jgi:hypothetical protein
MNYERRKPTTASGHHLFRIFFNEKQHKTKARFFIKFNFAPDSPGGYACMGSMKKRQYKKQFYI